jgi:hypothetical protein
MVAAPAPAAHPQTYDLRVAEGPKRFLLKLTVCGLMVSNDGLAWTGADGLPDEKQAPICRAFVGPRDHTPDNLSQALLS